MCFTKDDAGIVLSELPSIIPLLKSFQCRILFHLLVSQYADFVVDALDYAISKL